MDAVVHPRQIAGAGTTAEAWRRAPELAAAPSLTIDQLVAPGTRVVVVAPHPDDEILACGALLCLLAQRGDAPLVVAVTDGEASHPGSHAWPPARLRAQRIHETGEALRQLGLTQPSLVRLAIADGGVTAAEAELTDRLAALLRPGDLAITTWHHDGHPDHEATARACAAAARERGASVLQAPVWGWHWSAPGDGAMPWPRARKLALPDHALERKCAALACFTSQLEADPSTGAAPILPAFAMERVLHPFELFFTDHD